MISKKIIFIILQVVVFCLFHSQTLYSQENTELKFDEWETEHFHFHFEKTDEKEGTLSPQEAGKILEALWVILDEKLGKYYHKSIDSEKEMESNHAKRYAKCHVYLLNNCEHYMQLLKEQKFKIEDWIKDFNFYCQGNTSIYCHRCGNLYTITNLLHETTHFYCDVALDNIFGIDTWLNPGALIWLDEGVSLHFEQYHWDGESLVKPMSQKYYKIHTSNLKGKLDELLISSIYSDFAMVLDSKYIKENLTGGYVSKKLTGDSDYYIYQVFGDYLLTERPDVMQNFFQNVAKLSSQAKLESKNIYDDMLLAAFDQAVEKNPVYILDIYVWYQNKPLLCMYNYPYWEKNQHDSHEFIVQAGAKDAAMALAIHSQISPKIKIKLLSEEKSGTKFVITISFSDDQNYEVLTLEDDDTVFLCAIRNGQWGEKEKVCQLNVQSEKVIKKEYELYAKKNGSNIDIYINDQWVGTHKNSLINVITIGFRSGKFSVSFSD